MNAISKKLKVPMFAWLTMLAVGSLVTVPELTGGVSQNSNPPVGQTKSPAPAADNPTVPSRDARLSASFAPIVKRVAPSVVYVYSTKTVRHPDLWPFLDESPLEDLMAAQFDADRPRRRPHSFKEHGLGSGVVVSKDGFILTTSQMVEGADEIRVSLANGDKKEFPAKVVGLDPRTDIAVLKIEASGLPFATPGDSDKLEVGDVVLAVGNPYGLGQTVTMGIVSATSRGGMGIEDYEDFIQTDAAINPGSSGGALVDSEGGLIGINIAILSRSGGNQGVGFAVPVKLARHVMDEIVKHGRVVRGHLGVSLQELTPELARAFNVPEGKGALIGGVLRRSAAADAGLRSGDVIVEANGKSVEDSRKLKLELGTMPPGPMKLKTLRDGVEKTYEVTLGEMPEERPATGRREQAAAPRDPMDGVVVTDLEPALRRELGVPAEVKGALVAKVAVDSAAFEAGLRPGQVIQEINRQPIATASDAMAAVKSAKDQRLVLQVWSQGASRYLVAQAGKSEEKNRADAKPRQ